MFSANCHNNTRNVLYPITTANFDSCLPSFISKFNALNNVL